MTSLPASPLLLRLRRGVARRLTALHFRLFRVLGRRSGRLFIAVRWPWPLRKPYQRRRLLVRAPGGGVGDELMFGRVLQEIKAQNPACQITYLSRYPELFQGNPHLDRLERYTPQLGALAYRTDYNAILPPPRPLITITAEQLGLRLEATRLSLTCPAVTPEFRRRMAALARPIIVVQTAASGYLPNKEWIPGCWDQLVGQLTPAHTVVEAGNASGLTGVVAAPRFHSVVGRTSLAEFAYLISIADAFVGPVSAGMHLANAFDIPAVILFGGYESPAGYGYTNVIPFYTPVECSPCWLQAPCPYDLKCMRVISPDQVAAAVLAVLERKTRPPP